MIKDCGENPDVRALLITGAGTAFCAGGNVKGMGAHRDPTRLAMSHDDKVADLQERQRLLTGALVVGAQADHRRAAGSRRRRRACDRDGLRPPHRGASAFVSTGYLRVALSAAITASPGC